MDKEHRVRFFFGENNQSANFVYRPYYKGESKANDATLLSKFFNGRHITNAWHLSLIGRTRWQRVKFRISHPIVYLKRGYSKLFRRIKRIFIKDRIIRCVPRFDKTTRL